MRRYGLPYWAFVPTLGVWPDAAIHTGTGTGTGTGTAAGAYIATVPLPASGGAVAVNLNTGRVTVTDARSEPPTATTIQAATNQPKRRPPPANVLHPNTPSVGGPSWLKKTTAAATATAVRTNTINDTVSTAVAATARPVTKIYLKPSARAKAGAGGVALSNPISTAVVRRGDTVSIEYLPDALAEAGEGGVAISRPELVIHLVD